MLPIWSGMLPMRSSEPGSILDLNIFNCGRSGTLSVYPGSILDLTGSVLDLIGSIPDHSGSILELKISNCAMATTRPVCTGIVLDLTQFYIQYKCQIVRGRGHCQSILAAFKTTLAVFQTTGRILDQTSLAAFEHRTNMMCHSNITQFDNIFSEVEKLPVWL